MAIVRLPSVVCRPIGGVAQLGERLLCKQEVVGSIPIASTTVAPLGAGLVDGGPGGQAGRASTCRRPADRFLEEDMRSATLRGSPGILDIVKRGLEVDRGAWAPSAAQAAVRPRVKTCLLGVSRMGVRLRAGQVNWRPSVSKGIWWMPWC